MKRVGDVSQGHWVVVKVGSPKPSPQLSTLHYVGFRIAQRMGPCPVPAASKQGCLLPSSLPTLSGSQLGRERHRAEPNAIYVTKWCRGVVDS